MQIRPVYEERNFFSAQKYIKIAECPKNIGAKARKYNKNRSWLSVRYMREQTFIRCRCIIMIYN